MNSNKKIRFRILFYLLIIILIVMILRLYFLQVMSGDLYAELATQNVSREKTIPASRGNIYDRNGKLLVKSVPVKAVAVQPHIILNNEEVMEILSDCLNIPYYRIKTKVEKSNVSYIERVIVKQDIDASEMIYIEENSSKLPGVEIIDVYLREYSYGALASHILGYTGEIDEEKLKSEKYEYNYEGGDQIGLAGLEETYESILRGRKGKIVYEVDPLGRPVNILEEVEPIRGSDLYLTIDIDLQRIVEKTLYQAILEVREKKISKTDEYYNVPGGAAVVLDPDNGQILAMASYPTYEPEIFTGGISTENWNYLLDPKNCYPLLNRAVKSFPAGSVVKIVPAYAGLAEGIITESSRFNCAGTWTVLGKDYPKYCWLKSGHGSLNIIGGLRHSCDIYFYNVGYGLYSKYDNAEELLQKYYRIFGFGSLTGSALPDEDAGLVPDREWKSDYFKDQEGYSVWFPGDTVNMSIGQGDLMVTPLQVAQAFSVIANSGIKYRPHLNKEIRSNGDVVFTDSSLEDYEDLELDKNFIETIEEGLVEVIKPGGTGYSAFRDFPTDSIPVAGKTGTAEFFGKQDYAWFASYAPVDDPEYIIAAMLEEGGGGGSNVAPFVKEIYKYLFNVN